MGWHPPATRTGYILGNGAVEQIEAGIRYRVDALEMASLVTGLILFQVILLTLMGSNNGAREIGSRASNL